MSIGDPIASNIGHGAPGLRDNLRPFEELLEASGSQKHIWLEMRGGAFLSSWAVHSPGVYVAPCEYVLGGIVRDVVGVRTLTESLARAESVALCEATAGTYYFNGESGPFARSWDDAGVSNWDDGLSNWDEGDPAALGPLLFIHLSDSAEDPNILGVLAQLGFFVGSHAVHQPTFGPEKLTDGALDVWTSASDLTHWTEAAFGTGGAGTVARNSADAQEGTYCVEIAGAFNAAGGRAITQIRTGVVGGMYRACGYYQTAEDNPAGFEARIRVGVPGAYLTSDGRTATATATGFALTPTGGYWRRFAFDFYCPADTADLRVSAFAWNSSGGALSGTVRFDGLSLKRIHRFEQYVARLDTNSLPTLDEKRPDAWWTPVAFSIGTLGLVNGDGYWEPIVGTLEWTQQPIKVRLGGRFSGGGNEVLLDDCPIAFGGHITPNPTVDDMRVEVPIEDVRTRFLAPVPPRSIDENNPDCAEVDKGRARPWVFGTVDNVKPIRIRKQEEAAYRGLGVYELLDTTGSLNGMGVASALYSYVDEDAAARQDAASRLTISFPFFVQATGLLELQEDIRPIQIVAGVNDRLDFSIGASVYAATFAPGLYAWSGLVPANQRLADVLENTLNPLVNPVTFNYPQYDIATGGKLTLSCSSAFVPLLGTGANKHRSLWPTLGFTGDTDLAAATSHTSDTGMFTDCDAQHILRVRARGFRDDGDGSHTGTPDAVIELAPDIVRVLLEKAGGFLPEEIDVAASFVTARTTCPQPLGVYFGALANGGGSGSAMTLAEAIRDIEQSVGADLTWDGEQFRFAKRDNTTPANVTDLVESDYLAWSVGYNVEDVYKTVRMSWLPDPTLGITRLGARRSDRVALQYFRPDEKTLHTVLTTPQQVRDRFVELVPDMTTKRRRFRFRTKCRLMRHQIGDKVRLTRAKGVDATGAIDGVVARILSKTTNLYSFETTIEAIEVLS